MPEALATHAAEIIKYLQSGLEELQATSDALTQAPGVDEGEADGEDD